MGPVVAVFGQLYAEFPVRLTSTMRRLTGHTARNAEGEICAPDGNVSPEAAVAYATVEWLVESGYVRVVGPRVRAGPVSLPFESIETTRSVECVCQQIEVPCVHAQPPGAPDPALQAIDDCLAVLGVFLPGAVEQKPLPAVHP